MGAVAATFSASWFGALFVAVSVWGSVAIVAVVSIAVWIAHGAVGAAVAGLLPGIPGPLLGATFAAFVTCSFAGAVARMLGGLRAYVLAFRLEGTTMLASTPVGPRTIDLARIEKVAVGGFTDAKVYDVCEASTVWRQSWRRRYRYVFRPFGLYGPAFLLAADDPDGTFFFLHVWMLRDGAAAIKAILSAAGRGDLGDEIAALYAE